jgi:EmrB/QacA subfamily drug resistance transporter
MSTPTRTIPPAPAPRAEAAPPPANVTVIMATLLLAGLSFALLQTMVAPALPAIAGAYDASTSAATWVLTGFLVSASVCTPIVGKLGDLYGKGRVLFIVLLVFAAGSVVAFLAESIEVLIAARLLQGVAGGVFPLSFGIIRDTFPPAKVPLGIGIISATFGIGGGIGLVASGLVVDNADISWLFVVGLLAVPAAFVALRAIPPSPTRERTRIDWFGAAVLSTGLAALLIGVSRANAWGWTSGRVLALMVGGVLVLAAWVVLELRVREPLVEIRVLQDRTVLLTNVAALLVGFAMFSSFLLVPLFVQAPERTGYGFGASVTQAGLYMAPSAAVMLFAGPLAGALGGRFGSRLTLIAGCVFACVSFVFLALEHDAGWHIVVASMLIGVGIAFAFSSMANLIVESVPQRDVGIATGINTIMRTVGGGFGATIAAAIVTSHTIGQTPIPAESGFIVTFIVAAGVGFLALLAALAIPLRAQSR